MSKARILIVEDDADQREILTEYLNYRGYKVKNAGNRSETLSFLEKESFDIVLLDWRLPDVEGQSLLEEIKEKYPLLQVIVITAYGSVERAVDAMKKGAYHYLTKPINLEELLLLIERAQREQNLRSEVKRLKDRLEILTVQYSSSIIAESQAMKKLLGLAAKVAGTDATVLILGESGTGKGMIASLIHQLSPRKEKPFLEINCAAIPEGLLESELFGYEKGAFTGAVKAKQGLFEVANGGTIFLDEIGDLPLSLQAKLLRVLEDNTFHRVGGLKKIEVDVRVVAATNHNLEGMVKEGHFREDLFWRLNVVQVAVSPLRKRKDDIIPLASYFLEKYASKHGKKITGFSREAMEMLLSYHFPGNVRELENIVERAVILSEEDLITSDDLPISVKNGQDGEPMPDSFQELTLPEAVALLEKKRIEKALEEANGVKLRAASLLGISERVLRYKIDKYGLDVDCQDI
ncbi:MAG: two-component system response regulator [Deltaproteobacteria bacterium]|nr:MAG: two-component system response regulator [Deltaproteobacteria bacterium]